MTEREWNELSYKIMDAWIQWIKPGDGVLYVRFEQEPNNKRRLTTFETRNRVDPKCFIGMTMIEAIFQADKINHTWNPDLWY